MKFLLSRWAGLGLAMTLLAADATAVPAFARRYEVACSFCHDMFPKLNRMGERFKERGFRLETEDPFNRSAWLMSVPVSGRLYGTRNVPEGRDASTIGYLKVVSAGNLGRRLSYWVDDAWLRASGDTSHIKPDNAWVRVELSDRAGKLYAKAGRFELSLPFSQTRTPHLLPYPIYFTNTGLETDSIGAYQEGLEIGGEAGTLHLSAAITKGQNNSGVVDLAESSGVGNPGKFDGNLFLRASKRTGRSRFGAFSYIGRNEIVARLNATRVGVAKDNIFRLGVDGNVRFSKIHVYALAMYGSNSNSLLSAAQPAGTGEALGFAGGFLGADYYIRDNLAVTARVQTRTVDLPASTTRNTLHSFLPGVQWVVWKLKLSGQASFSNNDNPRFAAFQLETAF